MFPVPASKSAFIQEGMIPLSFQWTLSTEAYSKAEDRQFSFFLTVAGCSVVYLIHRLFNQSPTDVCVCSLAVRIVHRKQDACFFMVLPVYLCNGFTSTLPKFFPVISALVDFSGFPSPTAKSVPYNLVLNRLYFVLFCVFRQFCTCEVGYCSPRKAVTALTYCCQEIGFNAKFVGI